ncbi:MAG: GAF domain-containing protein [Polyangiales bacterium]
MTESPDNTVQLQVFDHGAPRVQAVHRLTQLAAEDWPLPTLLHRLCGGLAALWPADIVSVYLREREEGEDFLVMRANHGFPKGAIGNVFLRVGEGITGFAAECLHPVYAQAASADRHFKQVPGLGEESYPVFTAIPLIARAKVVGVLVGQRSTHAFGRDDIALGVACAGIVLGVIERARLRAEWAESGNIRGASVRLDGRPLVGGQALGRIETAPTFRALASSSAGVTAEAVLAAFDAVQKELLRTAESIPEAAALWQQPQAQAMLLLLQDQRLRGHVEHMAQEEGPIIGLRAVARSYALTPFRMGQGDAHSGEWIAARAEEVEDLCLLVAARTADWSFPTSGAVLLLPERLSTFIALAAIARGADAVLSAAVLDAESLSVELLRRARRPVVSEVAGLFSWARPDDRIVVDGDTGRLRLNPPPGDIAKFRRSEGREKY